MSLNSQGFEFHLQLAKMYLSKKKKKALWEKQIPTTWAVEKCDNCSFESPELT